MNIDQLVKLSEENEYLLAIVDMERNIKKVIISNEPLNANDFSKSGQLVLDKAGISGLAAWLDDINTVRSKIQKVTSLKLMRMLVGKETFDKTQYRKLGYEQLTESLYISGEKLFDNRGSTWDGSGDGLTVQIIVSQYGFQGASLYQVYLMPTDCIPKLLGRAGGEWHPEYLPDYNEAYGIALF